MISVLILTKNEEQDLPGCLESVKWSSDVHVFDSLSTDATVQIAKDYGAIVNTRPFDNYAAQRNAALSDLNFRFPWLLILDADERVPAELVPILTKFVWDAPPEVSAARIRRRDFLFDRWLKHCQMSPYYVRLVQPSRAHYTREVNEVLEIDGAIADLPGYFIHYPFSKGLSHWISKHNLYSTMEAEQLLRTRRGDYPFSVKTALFGRDFNERRFHQKEFFYRLPFRSLVKFAYLYGFRRGFLDGRAGFTYAMLQSIYEYMITLKVREFRDSGPRPDRQ